MGARDWSDLADAQAGLLSQRQLTGLGVTRAEVRHHLRMRRWAQRTDSVLSTTTGPLSRTQQLWQAVLHAGPDALVGGLSAAEVLGLRNWHREAITVLVTNPLSFTPLDGVTFFRTRRPMVDLVDRRLELPVCRIEPAVLVFAGYERNRRTAHGAIAATVQQRLATVEALAGWVERLRPLRRAAEFRGLLVDLGGGAQSLAEVDLRRGCREHGIAPPSSQRKRRDRSGKGRYTDAEWRLADGRTLVLEVDGGFHDEVLQAAADRSRNRKLSTTDRIVVSCSAYELRFHAAEVMVDLIALGVPRVEC